MGENKTELVKVDNGGEGGVTSLNPSADLSSVRKTLEEQGLMTTNQDFLLSGDPLQKSLEATTPLSDVLTYPAAGPPVVTVGDPKPVLPANKNWIQLTTAQQVNVLNEVLQIYKGLTIGVPGGGTPSLNNSQLFQSTRNAAAEISADWMTSTAPRTTSTITVSSYFSKFAESMATSSSNSASVSVNTPYGGGSASYEHAKAHSSGHSTVKAYNVGSYNLNVALVTLDSTMMTMATEFKGKLRKEMNSNANNASKFVAIVKLLNEYGWYVPIQFHVGAVLYTSQSSESTSWSEAQSNSKSFGASFHASFDGIGGGGAYKRAQKSGSTSGGSSGSGSLSFTSIGGSAGDANDFPAWSASIKDAANWAVASFDDLLPSIVLLNNGDSADQALVSQINQLLQQNYVSSLNLDTLQPLIDFQGYFNEVEDAIGQNF